MEKRRRGKNRGVRGRTKDERNRNERKSYGRPGVGDAENGEKLVVLWGPTNVLLAEFEKRLDARRRRTAPAMFWDI